jgi:hypothetical protein
MVGEGFAVRTNAAAMSSSGSNWSMRMPAGTFGAGGTSAKSTRISWKRRISW